MNATPSNARLGFSLSLLTALLWGMLPVALKEILPGMDAATIVWYRFLVAGLVLALFLGRRGELPRIHRGISRPNVFLVLAAGSLVVNYTLFAFSLNYVNAETSEAVIQLSLLFLILGSVFIYKERLNFSQKLGTVLLFGGLVLFFNDRFALFANSASNQTVGVVIVLFSAIAWSVYALLQKSLLNSFSSPQILLMIYILSIVGLLPLASPLQLFELNSLQFFLLAFCCLNTLVAYGAFAEAMVCWESSKVSAVLTLGPLFTIAALELIVWFYPDYGHSDRLNILSLFGAVVLVAGSALTALAPKRA